MTLYGYQELGKSPLPDQAMWSINKRIVAECLLCRLFTKWSLKNSGHYILYGQAPAVYGDGYCIYTRRPGRRNKSFLCCEDLNNVGTAFSATPYIYLCMSVLLPLIKKATKENCRNDRIMEVRDFELSWLCFMWT